MNRSRIPQVVVAVLLAVASVALAPWASEAQNAEPTLQHVAEVHIKPGMLQVFEAAHAVRNDRLAQAGVSFPLRSAVTQGLVYRFVTPVGDWAGLGRRAEEMSGMPPAPAGSPNGGTAIDHVDSYLRWTRPDLNYVPETRRLETADWQAMQLVRIYVQQDKMGEVVDALRDARAMYARHAVPEQYNVFTRGIGADGPVVEIQFWGSSLTDLFATSEKLEAELGSEMNEIRARVASASRRIEVEQLTIRRDLNYAPAN